MQEKLQKTLELFGVTSIKRIEQRNGDFFIHRIDGTNWVIRQGSGGVKAC
jgi:hypothetical protein